MSVDVVCPGSFDPVTHGHLDVVRRAADLFDRVVVAVVANPNKQGLFTLPERIDLLEGQVADRANVTVEAFEGLLTDFCRARGIGLVCKGLRGVADFEYEQQMAQMNRHIAGLDTVFLPTGAEHAYLSSSLVKEVARLGGDITGTVPAAVAEALQRRLAAS